MFIQRLCGLAMMVGLVTAGCGGSDIDPVEACNEVADGLCNRFYACYSAAERATGGLPATEGDCTTMFQASSSCSTHTAANQCAGGGTYHGDQASVCSEQIHELTCAVVRDPDFDQNTAAPACAKVCS